MVVAGTFAAHIRVGRNAEGLSQEQLADRIGVDRMTISRWERGLARPRPCHIRALTKARILDKQALASIFKHLISVGQHD